MGRALSAALFNRESVGGSAVFSGTHQGAQTTKPKVHTPFCVMPPAAAVFLHALRGPPQQQQQSSVCGLPRRFCGTESGGIHSLETESYSLRVCCLPCPFRVQKKTSIVVSSDTSDTSDTEPYRRHRDRPTTLQEANANAPAATGPAQKGRQNSTSTQRPTSDGSAPGGGHHNNTNSSNNTEAAAAAGWRVRADIITPWQEGGDGGGAW